MEDRPLPTPGSRELRELVRNHESRKVYAYLYNRIDDPPTMAEVRAHVATLMGGQSNEHLGRRLRQLRKHFDVSVVREGNDHVYRLGGWRKNAEVVAGDPDYIPAKLEAEMFTVWGARCAWCGKSPRDDSVRLVPDHIVPRSWGGLTLLENLQPLCEYHNHRKQAWVSSLDPHADVIRRAILFDQPQMRIGELLKAMPGQEVSVDLIIAVAREENRGDPTRRMRELRQLGWVIECRRRKIGKRTMSYYILRHAEPWPPEGPRAAIAGIERANRSRRRQAEANEAD